MSWNFVLEGGTGMYHMHMYIGLGSREGEARSEGFMSGSRGFPEATQQEIYANLIQEEGHMADLLMTC